MRNSGLKIKQLFILGLTLLLGACAGTPQPTISMTDNLFINDKLKVGIAYIPPKEKATTHILGADCLLCYAVAAVLTGKLDTHLETTINTDELTTMQELVLSEYAQRSEGVELVALPTPIDQFKDFGGELGFAKKDFRSVKETLGIDILVIFHITRHGAYRSFTNYIPNGDPQGYVAGFLYAVDLNSNAYIQYLEINETIQPSGAWDEPPGFPSVTTSYYQAVENTKQKIKSAL